MPVIIIITKFHIDKPWVRSRSWQISSCKLLTIYQFKYGQFSIRLTFAESLCYFTGGFCYSKSLLVLIKLPNT